MGVTLGPERDMASDAVACREEVPYSLFLFFIVKEVKSWEFEGRCWQGKESARRDSDHTRDVRPRPPGRGPSGVITLGVRADVAGIVGLTRIRMKSKATKQVIIHLNSVVHQEKHMYPSAAQPRRSGVRLPGSAEHKAGAWQLLTAGP